CDELVLAVSGLSGAEGKVEEVVRVVRRWKACADDVLGKGEPDGGYKKRRLALAATLGGMLSINGHLDQAGGATVLTALQHLADKRSKDDDRTQAERLADALI